MRAPWWLVAPLLACTPSSATLSSFDVRTEAKASVIATGGQDLLRGFVGAGAYAQAAVRTARERTEMQYGAWKFTEGTQPWVEAPEFVWESVTPQRATGAFRDASGKRVVTLTATATKDELTLQYAAVDTGANRLSLAFACAADDRFLGFGAQADGLDHRGHTVAVWTSEPGIGKRMADDEYPDAWMLEGTRHASSYGLPTFLSNRGYLLVAETDARTVFELCNVEQRAWRVEAWDSAVTLHVYPGTPAQALVRATAGVLGRPVKPPPMAFAPWNDAIYGSAEVRRVAKLLRDNDIPSSAIWTEDFRGARESATAYRLKEEWDLDRALYPDAEALARELSSMGLAWHAYFNTFIVKDERVFAEAQAGDHFVKNEKGEPYLFDGVTFKPTGLADLSRAETREWVKGYMRRALDLGFTGWMADFSEWLPHDAVLASGERAAKAHNRYPTEWMKLNAEVMKERDPNGERLVFFARAGWFGANQYAPVVWAGDQRTSFQRDDGLFTVVPMGLNLGLAGVSTFGHDIAGYQSATNPASTKELFFRWTSLGALSPVMRTHHGIDPKKNWNLEKDAETLAHYRRWAKVHVQLFPFFDGLAREAETVGLPIMRALALTAPADDESWTIADEYTLGRSLLVAPVVDPGTTRGVHLPAGAWVALDGSATTLGPAFLTVTAPLTEVPLWLARGAVIPRLPERVDSLLPAEPPTVDLADVQNERVLWWAPGGEDLFTERDGTTYESAASTETAFAEAGQALPECASATQRGCVDRAGRVVVRLSGQGPLTGAKGRLTITGPARAIDVEVITAP